MDSGLFRRRTTAMVAAYAVALQALLSAFVPMSLSIPAGPLAALCSHDSGDGSGPPAQHDLPCAALCAAMAQGVSGPLPAAIVAVAAEPRVVAGVVSAGNWIPPQIEPIDSYAPRGPPLA